MPKCAARVKTCPNCKRRYSKEEYELWACPECGWSRKCTQKAVTDSEVCWIHGAGSIRKRGKPGGRPSKEGNIRRRFLPKRMLETFDEAINDPTLLKLDRDLAVTEGLIVDDIKRLDKGESGWMWAKLKQTWKEFKSAEAKADIQEMKLKLAEVGNLIIIGSNEASLRSELLKKLDQRRKMVESERRRLVEMQQMVERRQLMEFVRAVALLIESHVGDQASRVAIGYGIKELLTVGIPPVIAGEFAPVDDS